jgi:hypothetical protein
MTFSVLCPAALCAEAKKEKANIAARRLATRTILMLIFLLIPPLGRVNAA